MLFVRIYTLLLILVLFSNCRNGSGKPAKPIAELDTISYENLSKKANAYLEQQQDRCIQLYGLGAYESWYYDQLTGELSFSDGGIKKLAIDYEEVGSVSMESQTFLWAWDNPYIEPKIKSEIGKVKAFGVKRNFKKLMTAKWNADEQDGWEMTAIAAYLLKAKGAYRAPASDSSLFSFMLFKHIRRVDTASASGR
ncbi:DUF6882 domain-containing protein [Niabella beijingensis]|uniref:DUF6882 domain-containing protein n=1 Tax=Niabella beijingensis TaxID=2872700 RepID=UPI001CBD8529|nr:DUF6882 domain-containing protein [Niabella beijingensis]MBZ4189616.1 hypothetical protein [Niabella beijingensis]